jgi:hypothetical protein
MRSKFFSRPVEYLQSRQLESMTVVAHRAFSGSAGELEASIRQDGRAIRIVGAKWVTEHGYRALHQRFTFHSTSNDL